jgi:hypothetical protein
LNGTTRTGIKRAFESAWEQLPHILLSAIVALTVFFFGLWLGHRDLVSVVDGVVADQAAPRLCSRIGECPVCERLIGVATEAKLSIAAAEHHIDSHNREAEQWKQRILALEQKLYDMSTRSTARPDPFTGSMGRALEDRIEALESRK